MIDLKSHSQLAAATADMMRACTLAVTQTIHASTTQGLWFWSELLRSSAEGATARPGRLPFASPAPAWGVVPFTHGWRAIGAGWFPAGSNPWTVWALPGWPGWYRDGWAGAPFAGPWASATLLSWQRLARWSAANPAYWPAWKVELSQRPLALPAPSADDGAHAFSSYRSAGGHAVAQVIAPAA